MSVNQSALSALQQSVTASNAEAGAKSALATWKGMCVSWEQETADAVGKASANYAIKWNNAVMPEIEAKIQKFQAEYDEKKSQYDAVKDQYDAAEQAVSDAQRDMDACMDYEDNTRQIEGGMFNGMQFAGGKGAAPRQKIIVDRLGYNEAKKREAMAKAELNRYKGQVDNWKRQMNAAESSLKKAENEKKVLANKIENFILDVYELNLMNESVEFLSTIKNSQITLSQGTKDELFSRLFFIQNVYRKQFEKFEELIKKEGKTYEKQQFVKTPKSILYSAARKIKAKKFKGKIAAALTSNDIYSAKLSYSAKSEFIVPKKKVETATQKIQALCKNFVLSIDRKNFKIEMNKNYENDEIASNLEQFGSQFEEYCSEYTALLDEFHANRASNSKIKILIGKIGNWHLNHWPKLWYKIVSILSAVLVAAVLGFGIFIGIDTVKRNDKYKKSFVEWTVTNNSETNEFSSASKNFKLEESLMRHVYMYAIAENEVQDKIQSCKTRIESNPDRCLPFSDELNVWLKENLSGCLAVGKTTVVFLTIDDYTGEITKRTGERNSHHRYYGVFEIATADDGSIVSITDLTGLGLYEQYKLHA
ncbi:hypothetical protein [uncultured Treponema sp.]|uniref:hypothetical protein n=1 Tax=uncultured Treponema sp. TaxID=162155 RepID=UPI0025836254|nr:hypothetical protein [uncultured Treponema sp.]